MEFNEFIARIMSLYIEAQKEDKEIEEDIDSCSENESLSVELDKNFSDIVDLVRNSFNLSSKQATIKFILTSGITTLLLISTLIDKKSQQNDFDLDLDSSDIKSDDKE